MDAVAVQARGEVEVVLLLPTMRAVAEDAGADLALEEARPPGNRASPRPRD